MDFQFADRPVGGQLGVEGYDQFVERAKAVSECERQRIELTNKPLIEVKKAEYAALLEKGNKLKARIYQANPPHEDLARRRRIIYCWSVTAILVVAGFVLSLYTLEPFQLGLKGLLYCVGIAVATPFLVELALNKLATDKLIRVLVTVASIVALVSVMTLAVVRGELLARHTQEDSSGVLAHLIVAQLEVGIMALAMTLIIIAGEIDLSVESTVGLSSAVLGFLWAAGVPLWIGIPAVLIIGMTTHRSVILGIEGGNLPLLVLTLGASIVTFGSGKTNVLQGCIHLVLFAVFLLLIFCP